MSVDRRRRGEGDACGVLVVDKPKGPTSHDVVAQARRSLRTRRVGHAGTLDPMATGVLVLLAGDAAKLAPYLTAHDKRYAASVLLGRGTTTLDAEGEVVAEAELPPPLARELEALEALEAGEAASGALEAALEAERGRGEQIPPVYSAIGIGGRRSHELARAGEAVELAPRAVAVHALSLVAARGVVLPSGRRAFAVDLELCVTKGYYVRSLARDLGERLGVPAHLSALRRTASGPFDLAMASPLPGASDPPPPLLSPAEAVRRSMPFATLIPEALARARHGAPLAEVDFVGDPPPSSPAAWLAPSGELVAIGERRIDGTFRVLRGFTREPPPSS